MMNLSEAATKALVNSKGGKTGAVGPAMRELRAAGLIGDNGGLTRKGSIAAMKAKRAAEDAAFGS